MPRLAAGPAVLLAALAVIAPARAAHAQGYQQQLRRDVDRAAAALHDSGYAPVGGVVSGTLNSGAKDARPLSLTLGAHYVIVGVCDQDCTGLTLALAGSGGAAGSARGSAARPVLDVTAPATATFQLTVTMTGCRQSPCYWGFQLFRK